MRMRRSKICSFFFSSRRRHTRCYRDWSSDVCFPISDARRHVEEFNAGLQEVLATACRLVHMERHGEAAKFLEAQVLRYNKSPEISQLLEQVHRERLRVEAFSTVKEQARDALGNSDFDAARALLEKHRAEFGNGLDTQLLQ